MIVMLTAALTGCQDDPAKLLSDMGVSATQSGETEAGSPAATRPELPSPPPRPDRSPELPGFGKFEVVHEPGQGVMKLYLREARSPMTADLESPTLLLGGPEGPTEVAMEPCAADEAACLMARSQALRQPSVRAILRYEINGQRFRVLITPNTASQPAAGEPPQATPPERNP